MDSLYLKFGWQMLNNEMTHGHWKENIEVVVFRWTGCKEKV